MPWTPTLYSASRPFVVKNFLAWVRDAENAGARQAEVIAWAKAELGYTGTVPKFAAVYNSAEGRTKTDFPHLMLVRQSSAFAKPTDHTGLAAQHTLGFELEITHASAATLQELTDVYLLALQSMLWKCPPEVLTAGLLTEGLPVVDVTDVDADQTRGKPGEYLQVPRLIATVELLEVSG